MDWQKEIIKELFTAEGVLQKNHLVILGKRKFGKSVLACLILSWIILGDANARGKEIPIVNPSYGSGKVIYDLLAEVLSMSDEKKELKIRKDNLMHKKRMNRVFVAFSSPEANFGSQPTEILIDELSNHESDKNFKAFTSGMGATENPLTIWLSNPSEKLDHFYYEKLKAWRKEAKNPKSDSVIRIFEADKNLPIDSIKAFKQADPSLAEGQITSLDYLKKEASKAKQSEVAEQEFRRLHLGQNVASESALWLDGSKFIVLKKPVRKLCSIGADLHRTGKDMTSIAFCYEQENGYFFKVLNYFCEGSISKLRLKRQEKVLQWQKEGHLKIQPTKQLDQDDVFADIEKEVKGIDVLRFTYDPSCAAHYLSNRLKDELGLEIEPMPTYPKKMAPLINNFQAIYEAGQVFIDKNPVVLNHFRNTALTSKQSTNYRSIQRVSVADSIDSAVAILNSTAGFIDKQKQDHDVFWI